MRVRCAGRSCPRRSLRIASTAGCVVKLKPFEGKRMRPGTKLTFRVTEAGLADAVLSVELRARRPPRVTS